MRRFRDGGDRDALTATGGHRRRRAGRENRIGSERKSGTAVAMALFTGEYVNKVDKKGRVSLPADFRAELPGDGERVIYVYPAPDSKALEAADRARIEDHANRIDALGKYSEDEKYFSSVILAKARKLTIDGDGRFVLPPDFIACAVIAGKATFVGGGRQFYIWRPELYLEHAAAAGGQQGVGGRVLPPAPPSPSPGGPPWGTSS